MRERNENAVDELRKKKILMNVIYQIPIKKTNKKRIVQTQWEKWFYNEKSIACILIVSIASATSSFDKWIPYPKWWLLLFVVIIYSRRTWVCAPNKSDLEKNIIDLKSKDAIDVCLKFFKRLQQIMVCLMCARHTTLENSSETNRVECTFDRHGPLLLLC